MPAPISPELLERTPLSKESANARVRGGELDVGAQWYAHFATGRGTAGDGWRAWRAIQRARGLTLEAAVAELSPEARQRFALWSFEKGEADEGITAYRAITESPGRMPPSTKLSCLALDALLARGQHVAVIALTDVLAGSDR